MLNIIKYFTNFLFLTGLLLSSLYLFYMVKIKKKRNYIKYILFSITLIFMTYIPIIIGLYNTESTSEVKEVKVNKDFESIEKNVNEEDDNELSYIDGAYFIEGTMIVNKTYSLSKDYIPSNTYEDASNKDSCPLCIDKEAYGKFLNMKNDAASIGHNIWIQSGYRSYSYQVGLYDKYYKRDGKNADKYSARPGHSEHQSGLTFDLNTINDAFGDTPEGYWINDNAYLYGFIIRYPKGKQDVTGFKYEPWHLRYVGEELAEILYNNGDWITLEEHFNIDSEYKNNYE